VFERLPVKTIVSWNALMAGHAQSGQTNIVLGLFRKMRKRGIAPDVVTFVAILTACSHEGLSEEGEMWFDEMRVRYRHSPVLEHYTCMIDLFGRAGQFTKLESFLRRPLTSSDHLPLVLAILSACCKWVNVKLGEWAFEQSLRLDEKCASAYLCMEKIYMQKSTC
jgi:pentatricopeptide repeat protein